ncbi:integrase, catalytic region, zinc finger, CCHC-type containing protein [Tanacetum coccineum]|uniref:Integrase, catalytic region, zinc finger, CCHC-type containing protein n=1 Tax=Tanacetum coccineum TaxID=301880 RepID=A0ABQ4YVR1_9ASTR
MLTEQTLNLATRIHAEETEGALQLGPERARVFTDLSAEEKERYKADIRATNILLQGIPKDIYTLHTSIILTPKTLGSIVKMDSGKQHEVHANENRMMMERFIQPIDDPLALVSNASNQNTSTDNLIESLNQILAPLRTVFNAGSKLQSRWTECCSGSGRMFGGHSNRVGNMNPGQAKPIMCYNCKGSGHIAVRICGFLQVGRKFTNFDEMWRTLAHITQCGPSLKLINVMHSDLHVDELPHTAHVMVIFHLKINLDEVRHHMNRNTRLSMWKTTKKHVVQGCSVQSRLANKPNMVVKDSVTSELARYKELVREYKKRAKLELTDREQKIDEQMRIIISNRNRKETSLKSELHSAQILLNSTVGHYKSKTEEVTILKKDFKQKEDKFLEEFLDIKRLKEKVEDRLYKQDQSVQTVHMLCKPKSFYDEKNKVAIGYKNPLCLTRAKQAQSALYNGHVLVTTNHTPTVIHDSEDTREIAEEAPDFNSFFKIKNLKHQIQEKDNVIRDLKVPVSNVNDRSNKFALGELCPSLTLYAKLSTVILWYPGLSCSKHRTGNRIKAQEHYGKFIGQSDSGMNHLGAIMGYGDYVIGDSVISRVYYVEGLGHNLFSVGQFCDSDLEVAFRKHSCFVRDINGADLLKEGYRIYNKRTRRLMETIHVTFDEMHQTMAPVRISSGPEPIMMTPGQLNSGLAPSHVPATTNIPPTDKDLEILFQPMFDDTWGMSKSTDSVPLKMHLSTSHSLSSSQVHPPVFPQGVAAGPTIEDTSITQADLHPSVNPVAGEPSSAQSTSGDVSLTEPNQVTQLRDHLRRWEPKITLLITSIAIPSPTVIYQKTLASDAIVKKSLSSAEGYEDQDNPYAQFYRLKKALYGLKQAPRAWYNTLSRFLLDNKFYKGVVDPTYQAKPTKKHLEAIKGSFGTFAAPLTGVFDKMAEENVPASAPTKSDEYILPFKAWLPVGKGNLLLDRHKLQKNHIFCIFVNILQNTNFFRAFTTSTNVPTNYIQQLWNTLTQEAKSRALEITPVDPAHPFVSPPAGEQVMDFMNELGYLEETYFVSKMHVNNFYQPWSAILSLINQCLTGKRTNIDYDELLWEEFVQAIQIFFAHEANINAPTKKPTPHVIPYYRFTKLIIFYLGSEHNIHIRPGSLVHVIRDDYLLGNLKFVPKGEKDEVFGKPILKELITEAIQNSSYYQQYLEMVGRKPTSKEGGQKKTTFEADKPQKPTPVKKPTLAKQTKLVKEKTTQPPPTKKIRKGKVAKIHRGKSSLQLVDEDEEVQHEPEPQIKDDEYNLQRVHDTPSPLDAEIGTGAEMSDSEDDTEILNVGEEKKRNPNAYRDSSSYDDLDDAFTYGDQFLYDKTTKEEPGKANVETEVESMVNVPIHQASLTVPPLSTLVIDLTQPKPVSPPNQEPIFTATTTTTTTLPPPPHPQQQSTTDLALAARVSTLEQICANFEKKNKVQDQTAQALSSNIFTLENHDLYSKIDKYINDNIKEAVQDALQAPFCERFRELSEFEIKEILHDRMFESGSYRSQLKHTALYEALEASMDRENKEEFIDVTAKSRKRRRDDHDPHPPPPKDLDQKKLHLAPPSIPQSEQPIDDIPIQDDVHILDSEDAGTTHLLKIKTITYWLKPVPEEERPETPEPDWVIPPNDLLEPENNWANAIAKSYKDPEENKLLRKTGDMGSFIKWYCRQIGKSKLSKADLEGPAFKIDLVNPEGNRVVLYLVSGNKEIRNALSISKLKAAFYQDFGLEELVPSLWIESEREYDISAAYGISHWWFKRKEFYITRHSAPSDRRVVRSHMKILSVVS